MKSSLFSHPIWVRYSNNSAERINGGNLSHSMAVLPSQRSFWNQSPPDSVCTQNALDAMCAPWQLLPVQKHTHTHTLCLDVSTPNTACDLSWKLNSSVFYGVALWVSHLTNNGLAAGATHSLSNRLHSQLVEVRLKTAQHVVQFINLWLWTLPLGHNLQRDRTKD